MERMMEIGRLILAEAKALGADEAVCSISESEKREFNVDGGEFSLMRTLFDRGVSITVLRAHHKGTVHINRFDEEAVRAAVRDCLAAAESAEPDEAWEFAPGPDEREFRKGAPECDTEALFARTKELMANIAERHPKILMEQLICDHNARRSVFMTSGGIVYRTVAGSYSFMLMYSGHDGDKATSFYGSEVTVDNLDRPVIEWAFIDRELGAIERQLDTETLEGKFVGPVILAPGALGEIVLNTVAGNFLSDGSLITGTSIWKDKLGEQVADPRLTISLTPSAPWAVCGESFCSEGYLSEDFDVIRDGVLQSFMLSQYGANKTGGKRAPNQSSNVCIPAGDTPLEEIIRGIDRGVLVMRFSGGQPAPSGEFSGVAKNSFLIENGEIRTALSETMISGSVPDMLTHIRAISSELYRDGNVSVPYIAFDGVTISGK